MDYKTLLEDVFYQAITDSFNNTGSHDPGASLSFCKLLNCGCYKKVHPDDIKEVTIFERILHFTSLSKGREI